jgi:hypothetical protein
MFMAEVAGLLTRGEGQEWVGGEEEALHSGQAAVPPAEPGEAITTMEMRTRPA